MAKLKKNTLSDLNEFLKHKNDDLSVEAVPPEDQKEYLKSAPHQIAEAEFLKDAKNQQQVIEGIVNMIRQVASQNNLETSQLLRQVIVEVLENKKDVSASDIMLLNTVLYLNHTEKLSEGYHELLSQGD